MTISKPLFISGDRNYSSSSLRVWLLLNEFELPFEETNIKLFQSDTVEKIAMFSPSLQLPVLIHGSVKVWDSLAICEYINETFLEGRAWPQHTKKRAAGRSIANELHADFQHFKKDWPMNCQLQAQMKSSAAIEKEIARLDSIIYCCRTNFGDGGSYLFGRFSIVDCILAPMAIALNAYGAELSEQSCKYIQTLLSNSNLEWWLEQAEIEIELQDIEWDQTA
ncbi:MAG: glutathione S-transferase [Pseudohongiellaceae bacterium]